MYLSKLEIKLLKRICKFPSGIAESVLLSKFKRHPVDDSIKKLLSNGYIWTDCQPYLDEKTIQFPDKRSFFLTDLAKEELEQRNFFTFENVFSHLIAPFIVGVLSACITAFILALF